MRISSRRRFLQFGCRSVAALAGAGALGKLAETGALAAGQTGYKALVCVFLFGGNDGHNTVIPIDTVKQKYGKYAAVRGSLALPQASLTPVAAQNGDLYGLHPRLAPLASLYSQKKLAILANVGSLVMPVTRQQYLQGTRPVPSNLFSHSDQQDQWQTAHPDNLTTAGWGGRAADYLAGLNTPSSFPATVTTGGCGLFCLGQQASFAAVSPTGTYGLNVRGGASGLAGLRQVLTIDGGITLVQTANGVLRTGIDSAGLLNTALNGVAAPGGFPATSIGQALAKVAAIINVRAGLAMNRQIFFVSMGGYDTHSGQLPAQDALFADLVPALTAFYAATQSMGVEQQVTTFTNSEFGRTLQPSSGAGTDHAWGSHHFILGGSVRGGDVYGTFPLLDLAGPDDANSRGTLIPTTSVEQFGATLATWFGLDPNTAVPAVFPHLGNFTVSNLGFLG